MCGFGIFAGAKSVESNVVISGSCFLDVEFEIADIFAREGDVAVPGCF